MPREVSVTAGFVERVVTIIVIVMGAALLAALLLLLFPVRADRPLRLALDCGPRDVWPGRDLERRAEALTVREQGY